MTASILTVDDSSSLRMAIRIALRGAGYDVSEAVDGLDGLHKARISKFDMIIVDFNMPNMNGLEMICEIRKLPAQSGTPVIFLTTTLDETIQQEARSAGIAGWLIKPFVPDQLLRMAARELGR